MQFDLKRIGPGLLFTGAAIEFLTALFYVIINYKLISSKHTHETWRPSKKLHVLGRLGILFLIGFSVWFLFTL
ncbi:hypothetical protein A9Q87_01800 [Flavobacteriales bacterium 34_180_T64]|nr:hypothetical protein A9Q87_01800 [Flavobacteriales bacterium 34_180_T64]